ncbi:MAG: hypothetical protein BWY21_01925 [Parcubacteria group bacterium ADurb.Bin216]|nr:MAG: hypothetical protein BWY21_02000 [Parcubacteria group bacterium ADurb.Bin216]OQB06654.1 MAG: hypothetical protein BWY21_01925 [Parcubacteria group bacterium ADurb.Bin216]
MARKRLIVKKRFTKEEIEKMKEEIKALSDEEVIKVYKFAPIGHPYFRRDLPLAGLFKTRLIHLRDTQGEKNA